MINSFYFPIKISIKSKTVDNVEDKYSFSFNYNILFKTLHRLLKQFDYKFIWIGWSEIFVEKASE